MNDSELTYRFSIRNAMQTIAILLKEMKSRASELEHEIDGFKNQEPLEIEAFIAVAILYRSSLVSMCQKKGLSRTDTLKTIEFAKSQDIDSCMEMWDEREKKKE